MRSQLICILGFGWSLAAMAMTDPCATSLVELELRSLAANRPQNFATSTMPAMNEDTERRVFEMLQQLIPKTAYRPVAPGTVTHVLAPACGTFGEARALNYSFGSKQFGVVDPNVHVLGFDVWRPVVLEAAAHFRALDPLSGNSALPAWLKLMVGDARAIPAIRNIPDPVDVVWIRHPDSRYDQVPVPNYPPLLKAMFAGAFQRLRPGGILILTHVTPSEQTLMAGHLLDLKLPGTVRVFRSGWGQPIVGSPGLSWDNYVTVVVRD